MHTISYVAWRQKLMCMICNHHYNPSHSSKPVVDALIEKDSTPIELGRNVSTSEKFLLSKRTAPTLTLIEGVTFDHIA